MTSGAYGTKQGKGRIGLDYIDVLVDELLHKDSFLRNSAAENSSSPCFRRYWATRFKDKRTGIQQRARPKVDATTFGSCLS